MIKELETISKTDERWLLIHDKGVDWHVSTLSRVYVEGQICFFTRVRNGIPHTSTQKRPGAVLSPCVASNGYMEVARKQANSPRVKARVHRLVGMAFVPGYLPELTINHMDGNKLNNLPENLEWVSLAENTKHQWRTGLAAAHEKLTTKQVVYMRKLVREYGVPAHSVDIVAGVSPGYTSMLCNGTRRVEPLDKGVEQGEVHLLRLPKVRSAKKNPATVPNSVMSNSSIA